MRGHDGCVGLLLATSPVVPAGQAQSPHEHILQSCLDRLGTGLLLGTGTHRRAEAQGSDDTGGGKDGDDNHRDQDGRQLPPKQNGDAGAANGHGDDTNDDEEDEEDDDGEGEDEDDGVVRCVCGERNDGELMIECETCQVWQHTLCMGIRDEAHIPDKYYCEKCHPDDHPYVNSRPKSAVYAEASAMGSSSMMRRSAVLAVAKMTSRDEYRPTAAAGSAATAGGKGSRQAGKRATKQAEGTSRSARRGSRSKRQTRGSSEEPADGSSADQGPQSVSPGASANGGEESSNSSRAKAASRKRGGSSQKAKRSGAQDPRGKRRRASDWPLAAISEDPDGANEGGAAGATDSDGDCSAADDGAASMVGKGKSRASSVRNRSASSVEKTPSAGAGDIFGTDDLDSRLELAAEAKRRGKSAPGSPRASLMSLSPSPLLTSLLYEPVHAAPAGRSAKRRRSGAAGRSSSGKLQRMAVSASNSPFFDAGCEFEGLGADAARGLSLPEQRSASLNTGTSAAGSRKGKAAAADDADADDDDDDDGGEALDEKISEPQHNHPPLEMDDINGNTIVVPSHLLNNSGRPIYSSAATDTMCRIHYPHGRASLHDLGRRAKQLLEWLGKTQVEYEHERQAWEPTASDAPAAKSPADPAVPPPGPRPRRLSDAPTSPIGPSDWPDDTDESTTANDAADGACAKAMAKPPRPTLSIMEDLMWRLIRFQETYSS
ncbi:Histone deacetylase complex subunit [Coemansia spiralis]|nr:Histone deacetylase complex subunit [Coemansia spiralis]